MKTLLIDGDALVYQLAFSAEVKQDFAPGCDMCDHSGFGPDYTACPHCSEVVITADEAETSFRLTRAVEKLKQDHWADAAVFALSDPDANFRLDIWPTYKGNRKETRKPILHTRLREIVQEKFKTFLKPRLEADDVIGIIATSAGIIPGEKVIISDDKDFNTIPGVRFKFRKDATGQYPRFEQDVRQSDMYHLQQTLSGDMTDFYPGCPKIGPVKGEKLVASAWTEYQKQPVADYAGFVPYAWRSSVVPTYESKGLTEDDALAQARCARILRASDFNFQTQEPKLWNPALS